MRRSSDKIDVDSVFAEAAVILEKVSHKTPSPTTKKLFYANIQELIEHGVDHYFTHEELIELVIYIENGWQERKIKEFYSASRCPNKQKPLKLTYMNTMRRVLSNRGRTDSKIENPPAMAQYLLYLFLPKELRQHIPGDLEEEFRTKITPKFGYRAAIIWYWKQVFTSVAPVLCSRLGKWIAVAWFGKVAAWLTSKLGS